MRQGLGMLVTAAMCGLAIYAAFRMLQIDIFEMEVLRTDFETVPSAELGNEYALWLGTLLLAVGTALISYKWAFGFDGISKKTHGIDTVTGD